MKTKAASIINLIKVEALPSPALLERGWGEVS